jgi:hypothetical protein
LAPAADLAGPRDCSTAPQVSPAEAARWAALLRALGRAEAPPPRFPVERAVMKAAEQRVSIAVKVGH